MPVLQRLFRSVATLAFCLCFAMCAEATSFGRTSSLVKDLDDPAYREDGEVLPLEFDAHAHVLSQFLHPHPQELKVHIP